MGEQCRKNGAIAIILPREKKNVVARHHFASPRLLRQRHFDNVNGDAVSLEDRAP
jgi:hypothetical protein